jgi:hypothetical protein
MKKINTISITQEIIYRNYDWANSLYAIELLTHLLYAIVSHVMYTKTDVGSHGERKCIEYIEIPTNREACMS